ncbi:MAG TPA: hypothetical protein VNX68_11790 [Nitrosopumilaceae archaeon]|jgi:hypothetical protein|nr:hypothetical protein [Nitrosopumilaceae archaeon]
MLLKDIIIVESFNVTGRGIALVTKLNYDKEHRKFNKGDTIEYQNKIHKVLSVEALLIKKGETSEDVVALITE